MLYELTMTYKSGAIKKERADLPTLMHSLSYYIDEELHCIDEEPWAHVDIMNLQTGEIIACWDNNEEYGVTHG